MTFFHSYIRSLSKKGIMRLRTRAEVYTDPLTLLDSDISSMYRSHSHLRINGNLLKINTNFQIVLLMWE